MNKNNADKLKPLDHSQFPEVWQRLYDEIRKAVRVDKTDGYAKYENKTANKERY